MLHRIAREVLAGRLELSVTDVLCQGEPVTPVMRSALEAAFGPVIRCTYGATECHMANGLPNSPWVHLAEDVAILEPVDENNSPVALGTPAAKVLLTRVVNKAQPLIRYEIPDFLTLLRPEGDPEPWTGRRIEDANVHGRRFGEVKRSASSWWPAHSGRVAQRILRPSR